MKFERFPVVEDSSEPELRGGDRVAIEAVAEVKLGAGDWHRTRLCDLSASGFRLAWFPNAKAGGVVRIRIPGLEFLSATIRWHDNSGVGCQFAHPLSPYVLEHIARHAR